MKTFVSFSGGNDSTALALLAPNAELVFTDTGWEFPEVYEHLDRFEQVTGREVIRLKSKHGKLPEYIKAQKFFPNHRARYCTRLFKIDVFNEYLKDIVPAEMLIGLRYDEPARVGNETIMEGLTIRYPLRELKMTRLDVVQTNIKYGLLVRQPPHRVRGGCVGCFYKRKSEVLALMVLNPEIYQELVALEEDTQDERGKFFYMFPSIGMSLRDFAKQEHLFDMTELYAEAADTSDYGEACGLFCNR